ncbi:MAG: transposase [Raoultibacter sp.]
MTEIKKCSLQQQQEETENTQPQNSASASDKESEKEPRRIYDFELKLAAVTDFLEGGLTRREVVERYDIASISTFKKWLIAYRREGEQALAQKTCGRPVGAYGKNVMPADLFTLEHFLVQAENDRLVRKLKGHSTTER